MTPSARRAFAEAVDPELYVPRVATESLLAQLEGWLASDGIGSTLAALIAPPGLGKTLLLRVTEKRLNARVIRERGTQDEPRGGVRALYLPYAGLSLPDLCIWVHGLIGCQAAAIAAKDHAVAALAALFRLGDGPDDPFYLLVDDADSMPEETIRALAQGLPRERSPLRIVMAVGDDARSSRLRASFDALRPFEVLLRETMTLDETGAYLRARLHWAAGGETLAAEPPPLISAEIVERIHRLSGGNPRRIHPIAAEILEASAEALPSDLDAKQRRDAWLGSPLDDEL
ncbi:MAG: hypothetical protein CL908_06615 [Deltaproteobacteria bacterium]|jgi:type II secretory pathway predicted ATPase ExeA|nr:hypothetical protein [Deltaproteobacteria bacterium]